MKAAATHLENAGSLSAFTSESRPAAFRVSGFNVFAEDMETPYMFSEEDTSFVLHAYTLYKSYAPDNAKIINNIIKTIDNDEKEN